MLHGDITDVEDYIVSLMKKANDLLGGTNVLIYNVGKSPRWCLRN